MVGMPGRSGGPRANTGGKRPGAGRKPKAPVLIAPEAAPAPPDAPATSKPDMLQFLMDVALGRIDANATQVRAAVAAVQYTHTKTHDGGKKEAKGAAAQKAAGGKFAAAAPPRLVVNNK